MRIRTFGGLAIVGSDFRRVKPLLLTAYLALEGATPRRYLAEIFWPGASDSMNSLSVALSQLRRGVPGAVEADESLAWSPLESDARELRAAFNAGEYERAAVIYAGPFLAGVDLELGEELEEWLYRTRESQAGTAREALLRLAETKAGQGRFEEAAKLAERALELPGAADPEPEELVRFEVLLVAGKSPAVGDLRRAAAVYGIGLNLNMNEARARVAQVLVGRERELGRLAGLAPGEWAWLRGSAGMGKTSLLRRVEGKFLPARAGLPYATLEPLLGNSLGQNETVMLKHLSGEEGFWLFDDWEQADQESRKLLVRLRQLRPQTRIVIASRGAPELPVDVEIQLGPLSDEALGPYPDVWEQTGGLPELVGALLREDSLDVALERRLEQLSETAAEVYLALALLEKPDVTLVRRALGIPSAAVSRALSELLPGGLIESSGSPRARQAARDYLESRQAIMGPLALRLARRLNGVEAFPLFERSRPFWEEQDLEQIAEAYLAWAEELLRRGFARRSAELLEEAPRTDAVTLLWARSLEQSGQYKVALEKLETLPESGLVSALKSALYWRLGEPEKARSAAQSGLEGDTEARAEALNTLGVLARSSGDNEEAASYARRAAALWRTLGNRVRWVAALNNLGIVRALQGEPAEEAFAPALDAAGESALLQARTLLNLGWAREQVGTLELAEEAFQRAATLAAQAGVTEVAAWAWNNLGVLYHRQPHKEKARAAYEQALALAQRAGEQRILGMVMANLAELTDNFEAWEEALRILDKSGHGVIARSFRDGLPEGHAFARRQVPASSG